MSDIIGAVEQGDPMLKQINEAFGHNREEHEKFKETIAGLPKRSEFDDLRRETRESVKDAAHGITESIMRHVTNESERSERGITDAVTAVVNEKMADFLRAVDEKVSALETGVKGSIDDLERRQPGFVRKEMENAEADRKKATTSRLRYWAMVIGAVFGICGWIIAALPVLIRIAVNFYQSTG